jgi:hypothetical protein
MKTYTVAIMRTTIEHTCITVEAANEDAARDEAFVRLEVGDDDFDWELMDDDMEVTDIYIEK